MKGTVVALALCAACSMQANGDTLLLDSIDATAATGSERPSRGASMATVTAQYGEPASTKPAVGEPPISRWIYPSYTVYFEHDRVINVVVHR